ncbi:MAG: hypothetical protein FJY82_09175 [Candidatus Aminicenantes bacterium]|nr:hypothetical protein [Candidatus Aminicenantes bacterium]
MKTRMILALGAAVLLPSAEPAPLPPRPQAEVVNCVAAVVNGEIITLVDVRIAETFGLAEALAEKASGDPRREILEALIDRKLVVGLAGERAAFETARVQAELDRIAGRFEPEELRRRLEPFGLSFDDLRPHAVEKVKAQTIVANRFERTIAVGLREIEAAYENAYAPAERNAGRTPRPFVEMIETLEAELRVRKVREQSSLWVLSLRDQAEIEIRPDCLGKAGSVPGIDRR